MPEKVFLSTDVRHKFRLPMLIWAPTLVVSLLMVLPLVYLVVRAAQADWEMVQYWVLRARNWELLLNTLRLMFSVAGLGTLIALPLAWLVTKTNLPGQQLATVLAIMPLAVPGYVMAYALLSVGGVFGVSAQWFGLQLPRIQGFWGATIALTLYTFPYLFLNARAALSGLDSDQDDMAASLGHNRWSILWRITLPQLVPSLLAGWLVVLLYTLGDFGAIALMRYEVFSYAIYTQYSGAFDRIYAAWLSLMLLGIALFFVFIEASVVRGRRLARTGSGVGRRPRRMPLGWWALPAWLFIVFIAAFSLGLPGLMLTYWLWVSPPDWSFFLDVPWTFLRSAGLALPTALIAALLAVPVAYYSSRYPSAFSALAERTIYVGYAIPPLTLGLALVFFALHTAPVLYQTPALLMLGWLMATLALALGPVRSALFQTRINLEEAAASLGHGAASIARQIVLPRIRRGLLAGAILVFVFLMKELPITFLLAPTGYDTLAVTVFTRTAEGMYAEAAPFAAAIVIFSSLTVILLMRSEEPR